MAVPKRFGVLRFIGNLLKVVAWVVLVLAVIGAIAVAVAGTTLVPLFSGALPGTEQILASGGGIVAGLVMLFLGLIYFLLFYGLGEGIQMQLAMEENTRLTAALLLRMHQESQPKEEETYLTGGFLTEPFEPTKPFE